MTDGEQSTAGVDHERRARDCLREVRDAHSEQARVDLKRAARVEASKIRDHARREELLAVIRHV